MAEEDLAGRLALMRRQVKAPAESTELATAHEVLVNTASVSTSPTEQKGSEYAQVIEADEIGGRAAAGILRVPYPGTFNRLRKRLQQMSVVGLGEKIARVPELGGVKYPGTEWTYSRSACERFVAKYRDGRRVPAREND